MKQKNYILTLIVIFFTIISCNILSNRHQGREVLTMGREDFLSNELKLGGMYNHQKGIRTSLNIVFFRNGIVLYPYATGYFNKQDMKSVEDDFRKITKDNNPYRDIVPSWGVFKIKGDSLKIEKWMSGEFGYKYRVGIWNGKILNDTTFVLNNYPTTINGYTFKPDEMAERNLTKPYYWLDTFRFIRTTIKPDSTCSFIQ